MERQGKRITKHAIASLIFGILNLLCLAIFFIPLLGPLPIISGWIASYKIGKNPEKFSGGGMDFIGLVLGFMQIPLLFGLPGFLEYRDKAHKKRTEMILEEAMKAAKEYVHQNELIPTKIESLTPFLERKEYIMDSWKEPLILSYDSHSQELTITSLGKDEVKSSDDIVVKEVIK